MSPDSPYFEQSDILYDHSDFYIVYKKPGIDVHSDAEQAGFLQQMRGELKDDKLFLVHRLDKPTSGIMIIARSPEANSVLSQLFQARSVEKYYLALSDRKPKKKQGTIKGFMQRSRRSAWKLVRDAVDNNESPAITRFESASAGTNLRLFWVRPQTGKTHQIRVALKSIGSPIIGDTLYYPGSEGLSHSHFGMTEADRLYLHACRLKFTYDGSPFNFICLPREGQLFASDEVLRLASLWSGD
ncbi:MAG: TIGR01621 family pseudouridine synthase [Pseudomonadales bacterium]|uniref:Pseudouridine synthase Rlu family protein n=1 Tax=Oleiphilus messinensis TaxID=141451 RepID=A0A1Y0I940_9GAMM|nr:TIGR01621 family pseudouridine synthase [Oleiphilus messinensis]ARU57037.1 pseudouridine synthase Rlu family protein [Oleiphilus messinensis]MCG8614017.1 TIGR01621 family pseudouridine synthase [Pseudomonadales bacterium]